MKKTVFRGAVLLLTAALLLCGAISAAVFAAQREDAKKEELCRLARVMAGQFDPAADCNAQANAFAAMLEGVRVTVVGADGVVTGDSAVDYRTMENHANRTEIMEARGTKTAVSVRQSSTMGRRLMYAVIKTPGGTYIRLAEEYGGLAAMFLSVLPAVLLAAFLSLLGALSLTGRFSGSVAGPIAAMNDSLTGVMEGGVTLDPSQYPYDELRDMAQKINSLAADVTVHIGRLQAEKDKISFILDNMREGFLLLDERQDILLINSSACLYMRCDKGVIGQNIVHGTQNLEFLRAVETAASGLRNISIDIEADGRITETQFSAVGGRSGMSGELIVTMSDVTESRNALKMRRDFFTNASHELKTPITSIKGSVELLRADIPLEEGQRRELLERIGLETERMNGLIGDIIMINRIESGEVTGDRENIDLAALVRECCGEVMPLAGRNGVSVHIDLEPAILYANHKNIYEMVGNLIMNAVKYNRPGGRVDIRLTSGGGDVVLTVRNDGDPIPPEHQRRVFERFYRVDKGRSKTAGGTGLGLSIVKHVTDGLGGTIWLESDENNGTTFTVSIPRRRSEGDAAPGR